MIVNKQLFILILFIFCSIGASAQLPFNLKDERQSKYCEACQNMIMQKPKEVLFGIQVNEDGDIYFLMSSLEWFNKIFKNDSYGISVDLVSMDRYACNRQPAADEPFIPKGTVLFPVYRKDLLKGLDKTIDGQIFTKIGKVPPALKNKKLEGNLIIVNGNLVCWYTNFVNIERSVWGLLPMGLFRDSLVQTPEATTADSSFFTYSKKSTAADPVCKVCCRS